MIKVTKQNINEVFVNKMFEIIGSNETYKNLLETNNETWYRDYTWNKEQEDQFREYALPIIKKLYTLTKEKTNTNYYWWLLQFGLKRNDCDKESNI